MFFVNLQFVMKTVFMKISAVVLVVWYFMSIIGFNVHTCIADHDDHGCSGMCCCTDVHEHHGCCGHVAADLVFKAAPCCTDDFQVLDITGSGQNDGRYGSASEFSFVPCLFVCTSYSSSQAYQNFYRSIIYEPESGHLSCEDIQSVFSVWRI